VCACGTHVLFPGAVAQRTCWNCGATLNINDPAPTQEAVLAVAPTQEVVLSKASKAPEPTPSPSSGIQEDRSKLGHPLVFGVLATSIGINLIMLPVWHRSSLTAATSKDQLLNWDTDGDGILDQHDFCPGQCLGKPTLGGKCSRKGWRSGRATDFDADGCEDDTVDLDKDNDGINDTEDGCPNTPQRYHFISSFQTDFDGDGCKDSVEDHDDDGDTVLNAVDRCPRTPWQHPPDHKGCSKLQLEDEAAGVALKGQCRELFASEPGTHALLDAPKKESQSQERTVWDISDEWIGLFRSAWVEVLVGAAVTELCSQAYGLTSKVQGRIPMGSMKHATSKLVGRFSAFPRIAVRVILYTLVFLLVYAHRYLNSLQHK